MKLSLGLVFLYLGFCEAQVLLNCCDNQVRSDLRFYEFQTICRIYCGRLTGVQSCCGTLPNTALGNADYAIECTRACSGDAGTLPATFLTCCGVTLTQTDLNLFKRDCRYACDCVDSSVFGNDCCGTDPDAVSGRTLTREEYAAACTASCYQGCTATATATTSTATTGRTSSRTGAGCFSPINTVEVKGKGIISMDSLKIGDKVLAGKNNFSRVYSFLHLDRSVEQKFLQIHADGLKAPLEVSPDHMVFIKSSPTRASEVKVGDIIGDCKVNEIKTIKRRGVYAPVTESGDVVVNNVLVSTYSAELSHTPLNQHFGAHAFFSFRRLFCAVHFGACENETYKEGTPDWMPLSIVHFFVQTEKLHPIVQVVATFMLMPLITVAYILEQVLYHPILVSAFLVGLFAIRKSKKVIKTQTH